MRKILLTMMSLTFLASISWAQTRPLSGTVVGDNGVPLVGASVTQKNSTKGTVTDANGKFTISLPTGKVSLVINSVGYTAQELAITNQNEVRVQLVTENKSLEDVVVVGYGKGSRKNRTTAVTSVKAEDLNRGAISDVGQLLQGKVSGLNISSSGDPTKTASVVLQNSFALVMRSLELLATQQLSQDVELLSGKPR